MPKIKESDDTTAVLDNQVDESFYHVGLLPAEGDALFPHGKTSTNGHEVTLKRADPWKLWNAAGSIEGLDGSVKIFVAKARHFLGLSVTGMHFPSVNEYVEMTSDSTSRASFPGGVAKLSKDQLKAVVKSCYRHVIRYKNGFSRMDDPTQPVEIVNLDFGAKPSNMTDAEWATYKAHNVVPTQPVFNPKTDKYVAEFVYIDELKNQIEPDDMQDYAKNPNRFHYQWVGPITRSFFADPPKSVSKVYPREA